MRRLLRIACLLSTIYLAFACSGPSHPLAKAKVEVVNGHKVFNINGKQYQPFIYSPVLAKARSPLTEPGKTNFTQFAAADINLYEMIFFPLFAWKEDGTLDTAVVNSHLIREMRAVCAINPNAYFQLRVYPRAPQWWLNKYPDERVGYATGAIDSTLVPNPAKPASGIDGDWGRAPRESMASQRWLDESTLIMQQLMDYLRSTDMGSHIYAFMLGGGIGGEWHYYGYKQEADTGEAMTRRFRQWLTDKYKTDEELQKAWNSKTPTLASATVPTIDERRSNTGVFRNPQKERRIIDYFQCHHETIERVIRHFAHLVKSYWPSDVVVGLFNGYVFSDNDFNVNGHLYFDRLVSCPDIDFFAGPHNYNYDARMPGGTAQWRGLVDAVNFHGKLWLTEYDKITHLLITDQESQVNGYGRDKVQELFATGDAEDIAMLRTAFAQHISRSAGFWFMDFTGDKLPACNPIGGGWNSPALMSEIKREQAFAGELTQRSYSPAADVAFFYDFNTYYYMAETYNQQTKEIQWAVNNWMTADAYRSGVSFDLLLLNDLEKVDLSRYRVIIFGTAYCMSDEQIAFINTHVKKDGRTVIFNYAPAYTDGNSLDISRIEKVTGMKIKPFTMDTPPQVTINGKDYGLTWIGEAGRAIVNPLFTIDEPDVKVLGTYKNSKAVSIALKKEGDYTVVYATPVLRDVNLMRSLFSEAGAHVYNSDGDVLLAGCGIISLSTKRDEAGARVIKLRNGKEVTLEMKAASTVIIDAETGEIIFD